MPAGADVETTWQTLTGTSWAPAQDARLRDGSRLVAHAPTADGGLAVTVDRRLPDQVPGFLQRFTPRDGRITQVDVWAPPAGGVRRGTWRATFAGSPGEIRGGMRVEPAAGGSVWTVDGTVQVKVPLLGGRIEAYVAPLLGRLVELQGEVLRDLLT